MDVASALFASFLRHLVSCNLLDLRREHVFGRLRRHKALKLAFVDGKKESS
jgi:hypothetical protein